MQVIEIFKIIYVGMCMRLLLEKGTSAWLELLWYHGLKKIVNYKHDLNNIFLLLFTR